MKAPSRLFCVLALSTFVLCCASVARAQGSLPSGWSDSDIGNISLTGSANFSSNVFTVKGSGAGLSGTADSMHFAYQPLSGDGTIIARVLSSSGGQAGLMIRETLNANASDAYTISQSAYFYFYDRTSTGGSTSQVSSIYHALPYWVEVTRSGNTFSSYTSPDGVNWTQLGSSQTITMAQNVYIGLVVSSQSNSSLATATFDNVSLNSAANPAPVITGLSATTGAAGSQIVISGSGFGTSQGSSLEMLNGSAITATAWSNTSITATIPVGATSGPIVVSVAPTMNDSNPVDFTVEANALPTGWLDRDVGQVGVVGNASFANSAFTVQGSGTGMVGTADGMHFVYQPLSGDGTIVARVVSSSGGQAGVMIRETLNANATDSFVFAQSSYNYFDVRATTGATSGQWGNSYHALPYWMKLSRSGNVFSAYGSLDGANWTQIGTSQTVSMAQNVYVGLAVSSQSNSSLATATFDSVSLSSSASPAPSITGLSPSAGLVGSQAVISGLGFGSSQGNSTVLLNSSPITVNSWSNTSITVTIPAGAVSGPIVVSVAPGMNDSNAFLFLVGTQPVGSWLDVDLGSVGLAGSASFSNGTLTLKGSGTGVTGTADAMNFLFQPLSGDGTLVARVVSVQGTNAQAGVMIRETLNANAADAFVINQGSYNYFYDRTTTGATAGQWGNSSHAVPYWLKLIRSGNSFGAYGSADGVNWTQMGTSQTITMAQNAYVGLVVSSQSNSSLATATFDNVSLSTVASPAPVISGVSPAAGVPGVQVVVSGSGFGASQGSSVVTFNGSSMAVGSWSDTAITATIPTSAASGLIVVSVAPTMNDSNPWLFLIGVSTLPSWLDVDIGSVAQTGSAAYSNGAFTLNGSGAGATSTADSMNFLFQQLSGDGSIIARIVSVQGTGAQAGLMIRETLNPNSRNAYACYCSYLTFYDRATPGASENNLGTGGGALPYWAKLVRAGNTFTAYTSPDGFIWTQMGSAQTIAMAQSVYAGLVVGSWNNSGLATATFDNVSISSTVSPAPVITGMSATTGPTGTLVGIEGSGFGDTQGNSVVMLNGVSVPVSTWTASEIVITIPSGAASGLVVVAVAPTMNDSNPFFFEVTTQPLPAGWLNQDIGETGGSATFSGGKFTLSSNSGTIWGTSDQFQFVYQLLSGDGTIIARVVSLQGGYSPQAGVMIRETLGANSRHAFVYFQPNQAYLYYRSGTGASTSSQATSFSAGGSYPYWVKLTRSGNTFTGYASADGVYWTQIGASQTITMAQNVYIGLALSSRGATASFDNVSLTTAATTSPVISALSASTGAIGSQLVITGSGFGSSQGNSAVLLNDSPVPIVSWADTSITITIPVGAVSGLIGVSVAPTMNDSNAVYFEVTSQPLPALWMDRDINSVGVGGATYSSSNGIFTVSGAGSSIGNTADSFHFLYQPLLGDGIIIARVVSFTAQSTPQIGVMIRETLDPGAKSVFVWFQPNTAALLYRLSSGGSTSSQSTSFSGPSYPYWLKLARSGNAFSGYISLDGAAWTQVGTTQTVTMTPNVYIGLAATLKNTTALFDNLSVSTPTAPAPVITSVSATTGSIGSQVVITGLHFVSSQGSGAVRLSDAPMTINAWADTSITITIATGAISGYLAVSVDPSMNTSNPVVFTVTTQPLPSGWLDTDIGNVGATGTATYANGAFTINAKGSGIDEGTGTADGFHFVYQSLSGDGAIVARVANIQGENSGIQAGVMIRETLDPGAANASVWYYPNQAQMGYRASSGASATLQGSSYSVGYYPYWVKLARLGNTFRAYISQDGQNWMQVGTTQTINMAQSVDFGLALCNCASLNAATFDNVSVTSGTMPLVSGITPTFGTIGTAVTINGSGFGSSQGTSVVKFNGAPAASITSWTDTQIVAVVPANATSGPVSVVVNSIESNTDVSFTFYHPVITRLSPSTGQVGATVTVKGSGFGPYELAGFYVFFNGVPASVQGISYGVVAWSDTSITVWVPQTTSGPVTVSLQGIVSNTVQFNVEQLSITGLSPNFGPVGSPITITGTGFGSSQDTGVVDFYGTSAAIQSWSDNQIVAIVPAGTASGSVNVTVGGIKRYGPAFTVTQTVQLTDSKGNQSSYTSAMIGGLWVPTVGQGSGCSTCTQRGNISYTYDASGHPLTRTDENGNTTTYTYDANGNVLTATVPISPGHSATTTYTYNSFGEVLTATDPMSFVTTNTYDANGNLLTVTTPAPGNGASASVTRFSYNSLGELTTITDPLNNVTALTYTPAGLIQTIKDAQNNITSYGYDSQGNRTSVTDANNKQTTFTYDAMNRLTKITYPDTTTTQFGYDYRGRRTSVTDQNGKTTTYAYDDADRLISVTDAASNVTSYGYDTESNLTSVQDANHNTTYFAYDAFGRVTQSTFPSGRVETYGYDNVGNLTSKTDRKNQLITYTYDQLNRLTQKSYPDTSTVNYTYDNDSRLTQVSDPTGTYQFSFDNMGRLTGTSTQYAFLTSRTFATSYGYDAASNRTGFTDPENGATTYAYDTLNRLQTLTPPVAISGGSFGFGYDALSRRTSLTRPNSISTAYAYDNLSHLLSVTHAKGGATIDGANYTLDNAGNRTAKTDLYAGTTTNYGYDAIYELLSATGGSNESYTYDPVGNRLTSVGGSSSYNTSNELTASPTASYGYDANGNTTSKTDSTGTTQYGWDFENRLTSVTLPGQGGIVSYAYDPFGRRIYKSSSAGTSIYAYDGVNLVEETNASGAVIARYSQDLGVDEPLAMLRSGATSYYHVDGNDNVTSLSNAAGALAQTYTYDSFGNTTASSGSLTNPFQYTAREWDAETKLQFSRFRYFDPGAGRFISEDPIQFYGGTNFYAYTHNRPTYYVDAFGLQEGWNDYKNVGNVFTLIRARGFANEALDAAENWARQHQLPPGALHNGPADAFRHCFWSCTMTRYLGEAVAETIADEHEKQNNRDRQPKAEELMDRANNLAGRTAALSCPKNDKNCWDLCTDLYNQGRLFGLGGRPNYFPQH